MIIMNRIMWKIACLMLVLWLVHVGLMPGMLPALSGVTGQFGQIAYADDDSHEHDDKKDDDEDEDDDEGFEELFKLIGKGAVVLGALSLSWYLMKRKMAAKNRTVRKTAGFFYRLHNFAGWSALALVIAHGVYFVFTEWLEFDTITGALAFILLLALAVYGVLLSRRRLPQRRKAHFALAIAWAILTVIHALDALPLLILVVGASYGLIFILERRPIGASTNQSGDNQRGKDVD